MEIKQSILNTLEDLGSKIESELGGLLDCDLKIAPPRTNVVDKAEFFASAGKKLVLTHMSVSGDQEGPLYVFCDLKGAIKLGGVLIMLPPAELEKRTKKEEFGEEEADAYGEIANIISGDLNSAFEENYSEKLHFKKTGHEVVLSAKVKPESPEPFPPGAYVCASYPMNLEGEELGEMVMLFPAGLLGIEVAAGEEEKAEEGFVPAEEPPTAGDETDAVIRPAAEQKAGEQAPEAARTEAGKVVLVVADGGAGADPLVEALEENGWRAKLLGGKENFKEILEECGTDIRGIFLVMENIGDQSFATVIKVRSAFGQSIPLIAAGSQWTRTRVLQAVKYGIRDILVLPASAEEILEKAATHFSET